jgi:RHS repeat-associated protein
MTRTYDAGGAVTGETYPSGRTLTYAYDAAGRLASLSGNLGDGVSRSYASGLTYDARGQLATERFGTATPLFHLRGYNVRGQRYLTQVGTGSAGSWNRGMLVTHYGAQDFAGPWGSSGADNNGNALRTAHYIPSDDAITNWTAFVQDHFYDGLNRLTRTFERSDTTTAPGLWTPRYDTAWTYDRYGNRTEGAGPLRANPNPIVVTDGSGFGVTTLSWTAAAGMNVEVRVNAPNGALFAAGSGSGSAATGKWVANGTTFYLQNVTGGLGLTGANALGMATAGVTATAPATPTPDGNTNRLVGTGIEYDAAGNMTRDGVTGGGLRTYDGENRMTAAQGAGGTWFRYVYDADGKRVKRNVGTASETWMVYGIDGELIAEYAAPNGVNPKPSDAVREYAYRLGEMLIQADASDCKWLVSDHLGSPRIILGKSGSLADTKRRDFMPFGEDLGAGQFGRTTALGYEASGTPSNPREKFATYERDDETGLDFAQARYYASKLGRFTSVDPENAGAEADDPQTWNAYAYGLNNPLRYSDPDGLKVRVRDLNGNEQILSDREAKDGLFNKEYQRSVGGEVKDGNIYSNGELVGTYERISFDDQSDQFNQLMFGNRFDPGLVARAPVMNEAIRKFAGATGQAGIAIGTAGTSQLFLYSILYTGGLVRGVAEGEYEGEYGNWQVPLALNPNIPIGKQLAGQGQLKDLRSNKNLKGIDIEHLLSKTPVELERMVKSGAISQKIYRTFMKTGEGRDLGGRRGGGKIR